MSQAPQTHPATPAAHDAPPAQAGNGKTKAAKARDKVHDAQMAFALLLTDHLHGDRHYQAQLMELARGLLEDLSGGPDNKEPNDDHAMAQEALGRLEGMPTGIRAAQDQPAMRQDEARMAPPAKPEQPMTKAH